MAQISSGNGYKLDRPASPAMARPKAPVGKEEALRMEVDALAKLQRDKRHTLLTPASSTQFLPNIETTMIASNRPEKDLIVFPESENKEVEKDTFADLDVKKLTNKELENLFLDNNFGKNKTIRSSSLLGSNLSASYPGGQAFTRPLHWNSTLSTPTNSSLATATLAPIFPASQFTKPLCSFQNGFPQTLLPFFHHPAQQTTFLPFTPIQPTGPMVFQQSAVTPEMAKLLDKIASTSEYLRTGRSSSLDTDSTSVRSLEPVSQSAESSSMSHVDWLDLDPLNKCRVEVGEMPGAVGGAETVESVPAGDPWDAVLREGTESIVSCSSSTQMNNKYTVTRRASTGMVVTGNQVLDTSASSFQSSQHKQDL